MSSLGAAQRLASRGKIPAAEAKLRKDVPSEIRAALVLGRILEGDGRTADALAVYEQARSAHPAHAPAHLFYAIAALDMKRLPEAEDAVRQTLTLQPENDLARSYAGLCWLMAGDDESARKSFKQYGFSDNRAFRMRLTEWMESEWLTKGRFFAQQGVQFATPPPVKSSMRLAQKQFYAKKYVDMLHQLDSAARADLPDESVLFACALGAEMLFDYERALEHISRVWEPENEWPDALIAARGRSRVRVGDFAGGAADLGRVLAVGPEDYGTNYYLGLLCLAHGERARARQLIMRAHTQYVIDTIDFQWWQIERALGVREG